MVDEDDDDTLPADYDDMNSALMAACRQNGTIPKSPADNDREFDGFLEAMDPINDERGKDEKKRDEKRKQEKKKREKKPEAKEEDKLFPVREANVCLQ